jgi:hypothetical protein
MAHYEDWLVEQSATITEVGNGSVRASRITLELSGQVYGTWAASLPNLSDTVRTAIVRVQEELPRGQHPADLIATDDAGQAVARLPLTIKGTNSAASSPSDGIVAMQRGVTVLVGNFEAANSTLQRQIELLGKQSEAYLGQNVQLIDALQGLMSAKSSEQLELARVQANIARWDALFAKLLPMIGPVLELGAGVLASKLPAGPPEDPEQAPLPPPAPPLVPPLVPPPAPTPALCPVLVCSSCGCPSSCSWGQEHLNFCPSCGFPNPDPVHGETFKAVLDGAEPEPVSDLAAFDAQRSLGGSKAKRAKPDRRAPKETDRGKR